MNQPAPKRFNSEACDLKHKVINKRLEGHDSQLEKLSEAVITLVAIQEHQEADPKPSGWLNTPAGLWVLKIGTIVFLLMFGVLTGINVMQFL